jgi:hypothetical protein
MFEGHGLRERAFEHSSHELGAGPVVEFGSVSVLACWFVGNEIEPVLAPAAAEPRRR